MVWGKTFTQLETRNVRMKVFCMRSQEGTGARETQEERTGFSPTTGGKLSFSNTKCQRKYIYLLSHLTFKYSTSYTYIYIYVHTHVLYNIYLRALESEVQNQS